VSVAPLGGEAMARLLRARTGGELTRPILLRLHRISEGNPLFALEIARALIRQGARPPSGGLTPTEQRIAELVGEGKKNREVADALFISVKTVVANLSRIFHKLGVRSRTELTRRLAQRVSPDSSPLYRTWPGA
jgi:DNA-binding NarL/FixJ family response regulator